MVKPHCLNCRIITATVFDCPEILISTVMDQKYSLSSDPLLSTDTGNQSLSTTGSEQLENKSENALSFWRALLLPGVILVS